MTAHISLTGADRLRRAVIRLHRAVDSPETVEDSAELAQRLASSRVRVDTGQLQREVVAEPARDDRPGNNTFLIGWHSAGYAWHQEFGTQYVTANPALTSAIEDAARELPRRVARHLNRSL